MPTLGDRGFVVSRRVSVHDDAVVSAVKDGLSVDRGVSLDRPLLPDRLARGCSPRGRSDAVTVPSTPALATAPPTTRRNCRRELLASMARPLREAFDGKNEYVITWAVAA